MSQNEHLQSIGPNNSCSYRSILAEQTNRIATTKRKSDLSGVQLSWILLYNQVNKYSLFHLDNEVQIAVFPISKIHAEFLGV